MTAIDKAELVKLAYAVMVAGIIRDLIRYWRTT
jgi:hypothetical protein